MAEVERTKKSYATKAEFEATVKYLKERFEEGKLYPCHISWTDGKTYGRFVCRNVGTKDAPVYKFGEGELLWDETLDGIAKIHGKDQVISWALQSALTSKDDSLVTPESKTKAKVEAVKNETARKSAIAAIQVVLQSNGDPLPVATAILGDSEEAVKLVKQIKDTLKK